MLSDENYKELTKYRLGACVVGKGGLSKREIHLKQQGFIEVAEHSVISDSPSDIQIYAHSHKITPSGEDALSEFEKVRDEKAKDERSKKLDRVFQIFLVVLGFALGVIAEHFGAIVRFLTSIF